MPTPGSNTLFTVWLVTVCLGALITALVPLMYKGKDHP